MVKFFRERCDFNNFPLLPSPLSNIARNYFAFNKLIFFAYFVFTILFDIINIIKISRSFFYVLINNCIT